MSQEVVLVRGSLLRASHSGGYEAIGGALAPSVANTWA
jgi:hypothetical protein